MTIEEIEMSLPNGLHDANLARLDIDYVNRETRFHIQIDVSDAESEDSSVQHRLGYLTLSGLLYCVVEPPDPQYPYGNNSGLWITSSAPVTSEDVLAKLPGPLPQGAFIHYLFVNDWNSFIYVAAMDARFEWSLPG